MSSLNSSSTLAQIEAAYADNALGDRGGPPTREHVHVVVRTPSGNDYGKELLRQHYRDHPHPHDH